VVSPLITLTIVYALLLLRSRIRRRRWRAPKSVVERLPVRTYQTMPSITSSTSETPRPPGSGAATPTSPLLESRSQAIPGRNRPRSQTISGIVISAEPSIKGTPLSNIEKQNAGSSLWRRKYTGRQVECVVCLEEYVDGQSRVMSLPCGHEFHAECITPWLTTRRRTCPICKGDVVRSLNQRDPGNPDDEEENEQISGVQTRAFANRGDSTGAANLVDRVDELDPDLEQNNASDAPLLSGNSNSTSQSSWRNLVPFSLPNLNIDSLWQQPHPDRTR